MVNMELINESSWLISFTGMSKLSQEKLMHVMAHLKVNANK